MNARCCGIAGTYGLKAEKYEIAMAVGARPVRPGRRLGRARPSPVTARPAAGRSRTGPSGRSVHPIDYLYRAYGLDRKSSAQWSGSSSSPTARRWLKAWSRLAREMGGDELALEAGGRDRGADGVLGTDAERVRAAIERAMSADGVLVLMDLGSALMSAEFAIELLDGAVGPGES